MKRRCYLHKLATAVKILKKMKASIIFLGMLEVLTCVIIIVESRAVSPREYNQIVLPGDMIDGYHQPAENYHKFEKRLIIGRNYPYDRYSNTNLFSPEERSPYVNKNRITFLKCIDRTPSIAGALMHAIRGGIGAPELVVDVMHTPVRFTLINKMVVACDLYTEESDIITNGETVMCNPNDISETSTQTITTHQTTDNIPSASTSGTMYFKGTTSLVHMEPTIQATINLEGNSQGITMKSGKTVTYKTKVDFKNQKTTNPENISKESSNIGTMTTKPYSEATNESTTVQEMAQKTTKKTSHMNGPSITTSSKDLEKKKVDGISSNSRETSLGTLKATSPRNVRPTLQKSVTRPTIDKTTSRTKNEDSRATNKIASLMTEIPKNQRLTTISSRKDKTGPTTEKTTLKATSPKTVESTSQAITSLRTEEVPSSTEVQSSTTEKADEILFGEISLVANKTNSKDTQDEEGTNSVTKKTIENLKGFPTYKLVLKIVPMGRKKKIGLAKIPY